MRPTTRRAAALSLATCCALLAACTATSPDGERSTTPTPTPTPEPVHAAEVHLPSAGATVLDGADGTARAVQASAAFYGSAPVAVLAPSDDPAAQVRAAAVAVAVGGPVLLSPGEPPEDAASTTPAADPTSAELERLDVLAVVTVGDVDGWAQEWAETRPDGDVVVVPAPDDDRELADLLRAELAAAEQPAPGAEVSAVAALDRSAPALLGTAGTAAGAPAEADPESPSTSDPAPTAGPTAGPTATPRAPATPRPSATPENPLPRTEHADALSDGVVLSTGDPQDVAAVGTARSVGLPVVVVPGGDPRVASSTVQAMAANPASTVIGLGTAFGDSPTLEWKARTAATGVELPGGGQTLFPGRRLVALYGTPTFPALGILGEQDLPASIGRVQGYAAAYQPLTTDVVVPAFEMIVTIASAGAGPDGNYSNELPAEIFVPWIEAARDAGVYVVLDLQPGRTDFLTQARQYESLLRYPNVGLALDPEWRLAPDQVHLRQIGSVGIDEVNAVSTYLADLTRTHALPQKLLVLHQFSLRMIDGRERLDLSRPELAVLIHADGQGSQPAKAGTWAALRNGAPPVAWGWKNFLDEDVPMLTPEQTFGVQPVPELVTYQ